MVVRGIVAPSAMSWLSAISAQVQIEPPYTGWQSPAISLGPRASWLHSRSRPGAQQGGESQDAWGPRVRRIGSSLRQFQRS
jgi:hypothetical protein